MIIQTLDIEQQCTGVFSGGRLFFDNYDSIIRKAEYAWKYSSALQHTDCKYLFPILKGRDLKDFSPDPEEYNSCKKLIEAHRQACVSAKVSLEEHCFFDVIPEYLLNKWLTIREHALIKAKDSLKEEDDFEILRKAHILSKTVSDQNLMFKGKSQKVLYDIFGSVTGRMTTSRGSIPVLTLKKQDRADLLPSQDVFVELDFNAAEIRTLLALSGQEQPKQDIHEWLIDGVFGRSTTREDAKKKLFSWLYNFSASESELSKIFSREIFRDFYCTNKQQIRTPFGRVIEVEERKAQNYLLQSTTSDIVTEKAYNIMKILDNKKSKVAFTLHDSIILDFNREDIGLLRGLKGEFEATPWGDFRSTCKIGKTFGDLREIKV